MTHDEIKDLIQITDRVIADEIKRILEENGIYSLLESDNPAASVIKTYLGTAANDLITLKVNINDHQAAVEVIEKHGYQDFLV
ncbi:hypothetical protein E9993_18760 [Labilibacter sediminis]|nr:hypothetical protein E9993_18760 [Labilibacter sediminis]